MLNNGEKNRQVAATVICKGSSCESSSPCFRPTMEQQCAPQQLLLLQLLLFMELL